MKIVTLYNHKGGVSKTTTTFNLARLLRAEGRRVLLVDADPQCNLTEVSLSQQIRDADQRSLRTGKIENLPGTTLLEALNQRVKGDAPFIDLSKIHLVASASNLDVLRGSIDLSSIEDDLSEAHIQRFSNRTSLMRTYVALGDLLVRLGQQGSYDFVFVDVGPSSGALTRACFLACDAFFVPVTPDRFNVQAVKSLARIVERWISEHAAVVSNFKDLGLPVRHGRPVFLGTISQSYKLYGGKPKPAFQLWMDRLPVELRESFVPALERLSTAESNLCPWPNHDYVAAEIPDFGSLAPLVQEVGKAVFEITAEDTAAVTNNGRPWVGQTWDDAVARMGRYRESLQRLAGRLDNAAP